MVGNEGVEGAVSEAHPSGRRLDLAVRAFQGESRGLDRPGFAVASFLGGYGIVWVVFGLLAFLGDFVLHRVVGASPWLAARPWLIEAGVLALAGGYQFLPIKRGALAACRHRGDPTPLASLPGPGAARLGLRHGLDCLGSSWALMLVMFAAGFASVWSMAAFTVLMVHETRGVTVFAPRPLPASSCSWPS